MPWCDDCSRFWSPSTLPTTGECPTCGRVLHATATASRAPAPGQPTSPAEEAEEYRAPWHFKLMVAMAAVYLTWRFLQLVSWLV